MPIAYDGQVYEDEYSLAAGRPVERADTEGKTHITVTPPTTPSTMPLGSPEKPADALNPEEGTPLPTQNLISPEPSQSPYMNPPEGSVIPKIASGLEHVAKSVWDAMLLPGNVLQGKAPMWAVDPETGEYHTSTDVIEKTNDLAGLMVMGPAPVASKMAEGTLGSFAGVRSATIDKRKYDLARLMEYSGKHPDEIWKETGFFKGADGAWRYEIPNDMSNLKLAGTETIPADKTNLSWTSVGGDKPERIQIKRPFQDIDPDDVINLSPKDFERHFNGSQKLEDVLHNPELFKAYPFLKDVEVKNYIGKEYGGMYHSGENAIYMAPAKADQFLSVLQHEVQHAIQRHEGFAFGGNARMFSSPEFLNKKAIFEQKMDQTFKKLKADHPDFDFSNLHGAIQAKANGNYERFPEIRPNVDATIKEAKKRGFYDIVDKYLAAADKIDEFEMINYQKYRRLMGEVESRNVQARLDFDNTERFLKSPRSTEDVPRFLQKDPGNPSTFEMASDFPKGYYDRVPLEQRLSRSGTEPSHPGFRWEVYDPKTGKVMRKDIMTRSGASRTQDSLDNKYGAYRYKVRSVKANKLTEKEQDFINANIDLFTQ